MNPLQQPNRSVHGRGAAQNPAGRFETITMEPDDSVDPAEAPSPKTIFYRDLSQSIIARNDSPDIPFKASINPYRGCEHGCIYCYARPTHEYLGFSAGLDFESRIMVKENAGQLLQKALAARSWKPEVIALSGVTDCYQPVERKLRLTRQCLEQLAAFRNPVGIVTKNHLVTRDIDLLKELADHQAAAVYLSVTTLNPQLASTLEPRTSLPNHRLEAIQSLAQAGIPVGVMLAPVIPALNDHEIPNILRAAAQAGASFAGYVTLRLPHGLADLFQNWLERHLPDRKEKVLHQIQSMRQGKMNDAQFGSRLRGQGILADQIRKLFEVGCRKAGLEQGGPQLSIESFRVPPELNQDPQRTFSF